MALNQQAENLEAKYASQGRECLIYMAGDFNMESDSSTMRYLLGKAGLQGNGTYWTDAWTTTNKNYGYTFDPDNKLAVRTALEHSIFLPELLPHRRIDYILAKGWTYGKTGTPLESNLVYTGVDKDGYSVSDHYGVTATFWNPRKVV